MPGFLRVRKSDYVLAALLLFMSVLTDYLGADIKPLLLGKID